MVVYRGSCWNNSSDSTNYSSIPWIWNLCFETSLFTFTEDFLKIFLMISSHFLVATERVIYLIPKYIITNKNKSNMITATTKTSDTFIFSLTTQCIVYNKTIFLKKVLRVEERGARRIAWGNVLKIEKKN